MLRLGLRLGFGSLLVSTVLCFTPDVIVEFGEHQKSFHNPVGNRLWIMKPCAMN
jgi:hypothetical protein